MDSRHLVDPELLPMLDQFPARHFAVDTLAEIRSRPSPFKVEDDFGVTLDRLTVPGPRGAPNIDLCLFRPRGNTGALPCIYHIHGGGFVIGSPRDLEFSHRPLVAALDCILVSIDYRLAPETRFPGAIEDCYAGLEWLIRNAAELGIDAGRLGVMGESAGGGLAAALSLVTRDRGEHRLSFQHLFYPMLDDRTCVSGDPHDFAGQFFWEAHHNHFGWSALLGCEPGGPDVSPYAAPSRATDLTGLPPTYIAAAALDLLIDENLEYARRLMRAGVPTELHVYPGAYHGFNVLTATSVAQSAIRDSRAALAKAMR